MFSPNREFDLLEFLTKFNLPLNRNPNPFIRSSFHLIASIREAVFIVSLRSCFDDILKLLEVFLR